MPILEAGARRIHYVDRGQGEPVVLVHSGGMSSRQWGRITALLSRERRVIAPDLLGYGDSSPVEEPFSVAQDVALVCALIDHLRARVHLVGHSYGGLVALSALRARPDAVATFAAYEPVAFGVLYARGETEALADLHAVEHVLADERIGGQEPWLEAFIDYWNGPGAWRALPEPTRAGFLAVGPKVWREVHALMADRTPPEAWAEVDVPALLLTGERSPIAAQRVAALLAEAFPRGRLATLAGAGHMGPITHADEVAALLRAHVAGARSD